MAPIIAPQTVNFRSPKVISQHDNQTSEIVVIPHISYLRIYTLDNSHILLASRFSDHEISSQNMIVISDVSSSILVTNRLLVHQQEYFNTLPSRTPILVSMRVSSVVQPVVKANLCRNHKSVDLLKINKKH